MMLFISQNPVTIKSYMLRSGKTEHKPILPIPDEFDENLTAEIDKASKSAKPTKSSKPAKSASSPSEPEKVSNAKPTKSSKPAKSASSPSETETVSVKSKRVSRSKKVVSETVTSMKPNKVVTRSKRSGSSKSSTVESETVKSVKSIRDSAREEWFDDKIFDTKRIKHTPKVKKEVPPEGSIACLKCNSVFETVDKLTKHEKSCYVKYSYECIDAKCTQTFSQKSLMNQHYRSTHLGIPFECKYCDKTFLSKKSRDRHQKSGHLSDNANVTFKYNCDKCDYKTDDKTEYTSHVDHHSEFKRYKCGYCDQGFYTQSHLTNHITHNRCKKMPQASNVKQKKEECSKCGKTFKSRSAHRTHFLDKHVKQDDGSMKPHCEPCLFVFAMPKGLKTHCTHSVDHERNTKFV